MQWNLGGWLGGQLGGSVWMLVAGLLSLSEDPIAAATVIVLFVLANFIGTMLWCRRDRLSPNVSYNTAIATRVKRLKLAKKLPIPLLFQCFFWDKPQRGRIDAIAQSCWRRTIIKHVAQMRVSYLTTEFGTTEK